MLIAAEWGVGQLLWSMLWFFMFVIWIWMVVVIFSDIFRSEDLSGGSKALWSIFIIFLPFVGIFAYLIARGGQMSERAATTATTAPMGEMSPPMARPSAPFAPEAATRSGINTLRELAIAPIPISTGPIAAATAPQMKMLF